MREKHCSSPRHLGGSPSRELSLLPLPTNSSRVPVLHPESPNPHNQTLGGSSPQVPSLHLASNSFIPHINEGELLEPSTTHRDGNSHWDKHSPTARYRHSYRQRSQGTSHATRIASSSPPLSEDTTSSLNVYFAKNKSLNPPLPIRPTEASGTNPPRSADGTERENRTISCIPDTERNISIHKTHLFPPFSTLKHDPTYNPFCCPKESTTNTLPKMITSPGLFDVAERISQSIQQPKQTQYSNKTISHSSQVKERSTSGGSIHDNHMPFTPSFVNSSFSCSNDPHAITTTTTTTTTNSIKNSHISTTNNTQSNNGDIAASNVKRMPTPFPTSSVPKHKTTPWNEQQQQYFAGRPVKSSNRNLTAEQREHPQKRSTSGIEERSTGSSDLSSSFTSGNIPSRAAESIHTTTNSTRDMNNSLQLFDNKSTSNQTASTHSTNINTNTNTNTNTNNSTSTNNNANCSINSKIDGSPRSTGTNEKNSLRGEPPNSNQQFSKEYISLFFHLPLHEACIHMKTDESTLKKNCRSLGISRWPYRKRKRMITGMVPSSNNPPLSTQHTTMKDPMFGSFQFSSSNSNSVTTITTNAGSNHSPHLPLPSTTKVLPTIVPQKQPLSSVSSSFIPPNSSSTQSLDATPAYKDSPNFNMLYSNPISHSNPAHATGSKFSGNYNCNVSTTTSISPPPKGDVSTPQRDPSPIVIPSSPTLSNPHYHQSSLYNISQQSHKHQIHYPNRYNQNRHEYHPYAQHRSHYDQEKSNHPVICSQHNHDVLKEDYTEKYTASNMLPKTMACTPYDQRPSSHTYSTPAHKKTSSSSLPLNVSDQKKPSHPDATSESPSALSREDQSLSSSSSTSCSEHLGMLPPIHQIFMIIQPGSNPNDMKRVGKARNEEDKERDQEG